MFIKHSGHKEHCQVIEKIFEGYGTQSNRREIIRVVKHNGFGGKQAIYHKHGDNTYKKCRDKKTEELFVSHGFESGQKDQNHGHCTRVKVCKIKEKQN